MEWRKKSETITVLLSYVNHSFSMLCGMLKWQRGAGKMNYLGQISSHFVVY